MVFNYELFFYHINNKSIAKLQQVHNTFTTFTACCTYDEKQRSYREKNISEQWRHHRLWRFQHATVLGFSVILSIYITPLMTAKMPPITLLNAWPSGIDARRQYVLLVVIILVNYRDSKRCNTMVCISFQQYVIHPPHATGPIYHQFSIDMVV